MKKQIKKTILLAALLLTTQLFGAKAWSMGQQLPSEKAPSQTPSKPAPTPNPAPTPEPPASTPPEVSTAPLWEGKHPQASEWTTFTYQELDRVGQQIINAEKSDIETFCPKYDTLSYERQKDFWVYLISAVTKYESNFKPETAYTENFRDSSGKKVVSRGLLQLSIESGNAYGCGFKNAQELHDPFRNLTCGIIILNRWIGKDHRVAGKEAGTWKGGARYWSTLRSSLDPYKNIVAKTKVLPYCK